MKHPRTRALEVSELLITGAVVRSRALLLVLWPTGPSVVSSGRRERRRNRLPAVALNEEYIKFTVYCV